MTITPTSNVSASSPSPDNSNPAQGLGQADFLKLLTVQMKNQDPMKPTDNNAFIAQMAQFAELSTVQDIKANFTTLSARLQELGTASALNFVGKSVLLQQETQPHRILGLVAAPDGATPLLRLDDARTVSTAQIRAISL